MDNISIFNQAEAVHQARPKELARSNIGQIGIVVEDPVKASSHWASVFGVTSWYRPCLTVFRAKADGELLDQTMEIIVGYNGRTQIELLSVHGRDRGIFGMPSHHDQLQIHHIGYFVKDIKDRSLELQACGMKPSQTGVLKLANSVKTRFSYWDMRDNGGGIIELIEQHVVGLRIGMPERLVRFGVLTGHFERIG